MGEKEGKGGDKENSEEGIVFKFNIHCEGCATKIKKSIRHSFKGVEKIIVDSSYTKLKVVGDIDPLELKEFVESKTKKKIELVGGGEVKAKKEEKKSEKKEEKKSEEKEKKSEEKENSKEKKLDEKKSSKEKKEEEKEKSKKVEASTVLLKVRLHCDGCIDRIRRRILKIKGVDEVTFDKDKNVVTVKGTMDAKSLPEFLTGKLNRTVELVESKKDDKKEKSGGSGGAPKDAKKESKENKGEEKKKDEGKKKEVVEETTMRAIPMAEINKMEHHGTSYVNGYQYAPVSGYATGYEGTSGYGNGYHNGFDHGNGYHNAYDNGSGYHDRGYDNGNGYVNGFDNGNEHGPYANYGYRIEMTHAPQMFSDENPNACSIM